MEFATSTPCLIIRAKQKKLVVNGSLTIPFLLLAACGSSGNKQDSSSASSSLKKISGHVIDGYINGARVFSDLNSNKLFDSGEPFTLTDASGYFSNLNYNDAVAIVADNNSGVAVDQNTGFPFQVVLAAPASYSVISPLTTLVVGLEGLGYTTNQADQIVKNTFNLSSSIDLEDFDPFTILLDENSSQTDQNFAESYQSQATKIANLFYLAVSNDSGAAQSQFSSVLQSLSYVVKDRDASGEKVELSDISTLREVLPTHSLEVLQQISQVNSEGNYSELLDQHLLLMSNQSNGEIELDVSMCAEHIHDKSKQWGEPIFTIPPQTGQLVAFPSYVYHQVKPVTVECDRYCIAGNVHHDFEVKQGWYDHT